MENRAGSAGVPASEAVVRAASDGYTFGIFSSTYVSNEVTQPHLSFSVVDDITPISMVVIILLADGNAGPDLESTLPVAFDRRLSDFPRLKVAVAHGGWPWVHQVLHIAFRRSNLYLSPDMYLVNVPGMSDYVRAADGFLCERFIYGSSFPACSAKAMLDWFNTLPISAANRLRILDDQRAHLPGAVMTLKL